MENAKPRCPYLAINIPGERPFVVERRLYESATRGIHIVDTTLTKELVKDHGEIWVLTVKHDSGRVRGTLKFYSLLQTKFKGTYWIFKRDLADWAARAFKKKCASVAGPPSKHAKQIARLERELAKLYAHQPKNPLLREPSVYHMGREYTERWYGDRSQRMQLALIGGWVLKGVITPVKAYELLEEAGYSVRRFSKVTPNTRRHYDVHFDVDYWKKLYCFASGLEDRRRTFVDTPLPQQLTEHREHLIQFIEKRREIVSIENQIASIKLLAEAVVPAANETGVVYA
jgi:hypothetical protein